MNKTCWGGVWWKTLVGLLGVFGCAVIASNTGAEWLIPAGVVAVSGRPYYKSPEEVKDRKTNKGEMITAEKQIADIRDVREDFDAPNMPFVIGVIGVGGNPDKPDVFRKAMAAPAALPEFKGHVVAVHTAEFWDHQLSELSAR